MILRTPFLLAFFFAAIAAWAAGSPIPGDSALGAQEFKTQRCVDCHSVNNEGGKIAPDLGRKSGRDYSPSIMAALMWNHAPAMFAEIEKQKIEKAQMSDEQAANLFAYFFAARYFEKPGDAGRGRQLFVSKRCADCHQLSEKGNSPGPAVKDWQAVVDPISLAQQMWNHAPQMKTELAKRKASWPKLSAQEMTDIVVYLQNLPQAKGLKPEFAPASPETGASLFQWKGCAECHRGNNALNNKFGRRTTADFVASMWNHAPLMVQMPPTLNSEEMRRLVGYLWSIQFFDDRGDASRGSAVFKNKGCAGCHVGGGAPNLGGRERSAFSMVSALWQHGPQMLAKMKQKNAVWPRFNRTEMPDLIAYLNSLK